MIVGFIIFCLGMGGLFIINKINLSSVQTNVDKLKVQVKGQESSEQRLILLKDRLDKIASVKSTPNALKNISSIDSFLANVSPSTIMDQADFGATKIDVSFKIGSNEDLVSLMQNVKSTDLFKAVDLYSFDYGPSIGYLIKLSMNNK
jgi:hypothetical protein